MAAAELPACVREPERRTLDAAVVAVEASPGATEVVLDDTVLYPEGGGQPADHGRLVRLDDGAVFAVVDVQRRAGAIRHRLGRGTPEAASGAAGPATGTTTSPRPLAAGDAVRVEVDWARRLDHMQQHTAQHLLTALAQDRFGWATTAFHLGALRSDIELAVPSLASADLEALEEACAAAIREARPVRPRIVALDDYAGLAVRTRGLPDGFGGPVRLVEIDGLDLNTCGGTHVASTAAIEGLKLLATEPMRGGTRLHFVAGARLRRRLAEHEERNAALRTLLGTGDAEFAAAVAQKLEQLRELGRELRAAHEELAEAAAAALAAEPGTLAERHWEAAETPFLQQVAREAVRRTPHLVVFVSGGADEGPFVLAAGTEASIDLPAVGRRVAELLGGRGGGAAGMFQGKASKLSRRSEAAAILRAALAPADDGTAPVH